jgi:hypothetical protein
MLSSSIVTRAFLVAVGLCSAACGHDESVAVNFGPLNAVTTSVAGTRMVFLGHQTDLVAELRQSLVGNVPDEPWYRVELFDSMMPSPADTFTFDLAKTTGVRVVINFAVPDPTNWARYYRVVDGTSAGGNLSGSLVLSGSHVVNGNSPITDTGAPIGVGLSCEIVQTIVLPTVVLTNHRASFNVGTLLAPRAPGSW